jgi:transcriptional regulator with XRE-family HTH domain
VKPHGGESFGEMARRLRESLGLSREQVEARGGPSVDTLEDLERGRRHPQRGTVEALAKTLNLTDEERAALFAAWEDDARTAPRSLRPASEVVGVRDPVRIPSPFGARWLLLAGIVAVVALIGLVIVRPVRAPTVPSATSTRPTPVDTPERSATFTFTSGVNNEHGRQEFHLQPQGAGRYSIVLESINPPNAGHSLVWDYIALRQGPTARWEIGEDETPNNYGERAFDEFCDTSARRDCTTNFVVGMTRAQDFSKDLNDGSRSAARIDFALDDAQAAEGVQLVLSTLYATHPGAPDFKMRITLVKL